MYVRCLSRFCQRGVLTVPARDIEEDAELSSNRPQDKAVTATKFEAEEGNLLTNDVFKLIAYCHRLLCPLDREQDFGVFWSCAEDKCVPWFESAWRQQHHHEHHEHEDTEQITWLKEATASLKASQGTGVEDKKPVKSTTMPPPAPRSSYDSMVCTEQRIGEPGCDWQTLYRQKNAPLARKRRINDDVSQCIQSYCGAKNDLNQRVFCVIKHCHRIRSFN